MPTDPRVRDAAKRALVFATTWFALHTLFIVIDGLYDRAGHADVAVVLGNTVEPDGTPSPRLRARLDRAVELYRRGLVPLVMVSGGFGREGFEEADVMAAYVEAAGIPRAHIVVDRDGIDTEHTAINATHMMRARGIDSAIAVSQFFHLTRTKLALRNAGIAHVSSAHARYFEPRDAYSTVREFFGFYAYLLRGWRHARPRRTRHMTETSRSLPLSAYRSHIDLDTPFVPRHAASERERLALIELVIGHLERDGTGDKLRAVLGDASAADGDRRQTLKSNLPSRFVIHTVRPIVDGTPTSNDDARPVSVYRASLDLAHEIGSVRSVVLCGVSTGVFADADRAAYALALELAAR